MSAIATGREARWPEPPSWLRCVGAVIGGALLAWAATFVLLLAAWPLHLLPEYTSQVSGHGWPWRVEDAWSFAADLGPLLLLGLVAAIGTTAYTGRWTGLRPRRLPIALTAAACGFIPAVSGHPGLLDVSGLALAAATLSHAALRPLTAGDGGGEPDRTGIYLHNDGPLSVRILDVDVPDEHARLLAGTTIASGQSKIVYLKGSCRPIDRVVVRMHVAGRDARQSIPLERAVSC